MKAQFPAWLWGLGGLVMAVVGFTAAVAEILNYFEIKPRDFAGWTASKVDSILDSASQPEKTEPMSKRAVSFAPNQQAGQRTPELKDKGDIEPSRPARIVIVLKNERDMKAVSRAASLFAARLIPADRVTLIAFADGEPITLFRDLAAEDARIQIEERVKLLFCMPRIRTRSAVNDVIEQLGRNPVPGMNSAVVILSPSCDSNEAVDLLLQRLRARNATAPFVIASSRDLDEA
jgi:hypothetical protein